MLTNTDLTLYSRSNDQSGASYTRTVITEVQWESRKAANQIASGMIQANKYRVFIPTFGRVDIIEALSIKAEDVIVEGIVTKEITSSYTIKDLRAEYDDVAVIKSVDYKKFGSPQLRHLEIGAT